MDWIVGFMLGMVIALVANYVVLSDKTVSILTETCSNNKGLDKAIVDLFEYRLTCKDGAVFRIKN